MDSPLLQAVHLRSGNVPGVPLHEPLAFELLAGERLAIVGASGVGKTTLLRTVAGLQDSLTGLTLLQGKNPGEWGWPEYRSRAVLVSQHPALLAVSAEDNLRLPFGYKALRTKAYSPERAGALMERLGLHREQLSQPAGSLSIGEQQRLCLVRALLLEPLVLCLDEPTSALDPDSTAAVESLITEESARTGLAALIVTHNPEQAARWCHQQIALQRPVASAPDATVPSPAEERQ